MTEQIDRGETPDVEETSGSQGDAPPVLEASIRDPYFGVVPEPRPAAWYRENGQRNMSTGGRQSAEAVKLADSIDSVDRFDRSGWTFAFPSRVGVSRGRDDEGAEPELSSPFKEGFRKYRYAGKRFRPPRDDHPMVEVNSMWTVDLPDGYSLLLLPRSILADTRFEIIPRMIDADSYPGIVRIPIQVLDPPTELDLGTQLAQAIPVDREICGLNARIGPAPAIAERSAKGPNEGGVPPENLAYLCDDSLFGELPAPEPAHSYVKKRRSGRVSTERCWQKPLRLTSVDTPARDALELGWFVKLPVGVDASVSDDGTCSTNSPQTDSAGPPDDVVTRPSVNDSTENSYLRLDTCWDVVAPAGYDVLVLPRFCAPERTFTVVSERISPDSDDRAVRLEPLVRVHGEGLELEAGRPIARVVLVRQDTLTGEVHPDVMTDSQEHELTRYRKGMEMYDYYADEVRETRPEPKRLDAPADD